MLLKVYNLVDKLNNSSTQTKAKFERLLLYLKNTQFELRNISDQSRKLSIAFQELSDDIVKEFEHITQICEIAIIETKTFPSINTTEEEDKDIWLDCFLRILQNICRYFRSRIGFDFQDIPKENINRSPVSSDLLTYICNTELRISEYRTSRDVVL